jgi:hypothetical protein
MRHAKFTRKHGRPAPQEPRWIGIRARSGKTFKTPDRQTHGKAERRYPIAGSNTPGSRSGLQFVQGGYIEPAPQMPIYIGCAKRPGRGRRRPGNRLLVRGATLKAGDGCSQTFKHPSFAVARDRAPRNGEEGLAVPVRARALKPNATQPMTRTHTGAWLWPRDPWQTAGRWGGGWDRLFHGDALALNEATARPVAFFFCSRRPPRRRQDQMGNKRRLLKLHGLIWRRVKFSTAEILPTDESIRHATRMPHNQPRICRRIRHLVVHEGNTRAEIYKKAAIGCGCEAGVSLVLCHDKMGLL